LELESESDNRNFQESESDDGTSDSTALCARHRHDGRVTSFECQTPVSPSSCCMVNSVLVERSEDKLSRGGRKIEGQCKRYKDSFKAYLKDFNIDVTTWENAESDRLAWRSMVHRGALYSEFERFTTAKKTPDTKGSS